MHQRPKVNLPLIEILGLSTLLHVILIVLIGGITIYQHLKSDDAEFEALVPDEPIKLEKLKYKVSVQKSQQSSSAPPKSRITVKTLDQITVPKFTVNLPETQIRSSFGRRGAASGDGQGLGRGGGGSIGFGLSSVDFFGIKDQGERVMFIIDASKYILEDQKGGIPAYNIVKQEIGRMVDQLSVHTMFNAMVYEGRSVNIFKPQMVTADQSQKDALKRWLDPINKERYTGPKGNNFKPKVLVKPMEENIMQFAKAIQAGMEQNVDTIFLMLSGWQFMNLGLKGEELKKWYAKRGWTAADEAKWNATVPKARAWLKAESAKRKAKGGTEKVVHSIHSVIKKQFPGVKLRPAPSFSDEEVIKHINNVANRHYPKKSESPPVHVVLFQGKNEPNAEKHANRVQPIARSTGGKFRKITGLAGLKNVTGRN